MSVGVRWLSLGPGSGYGNSSEAYISGLRSAGIPVSWGPIEWVPNVWGQPLGPVEHADREGQRHGDIANIPIEHDAVVVHATPVWAEQLAREAEGRLLAAFTTWEADRLPPDRVAILNRYDRVLVPSCFNAAIFESSGVTKPIHVVPHIARAISPAEHAERHAAKPKFVFYMIATWTTRKAILDAVDAFIAAFRAEDPVRLVIHTTAEDLVTSARPVDEAGIITASRNASWYTLARALSGHAGVPEIVLSTRQLSDAQIDALHAGCDCFVSLSRGEGWGLGAFDAAAFGNPVVVTGWSGTLEFLPADYPYCVEYDLVPTISEPRDAWWAPRPGENWAKARVPHAARLLREVFERRDEAREWGRALQANVLVQFDSERITARLLDALRAEPALSERSSHEGVAG